MRASLLALVALALGCSGPATPQSSGPVAGHVRSYGWVRPATPAPATYALRATGEPLPDRVDLRPFDVPIYDQEQLGSCTANAWAAHLAYREQARAGPKAGPPSRLFVYYNERYLEGTTGRDAGAAVRSGAKALELFGAPREADWPYRADQFTRQPSSLAYLRARFHRTPAATAISTSDLIEVRTALAAGHPIVFGFNAYESFERVGPDGLYVPAGRYVGGHCVEAVGYDDRARVIIARNSWGPRWGAAGYFLFPYPYFASGMTGDAWTIAD